MSITAAIIIVGHIAPNLTPDVFVARIAPGGTIPPPPAAAGYYDSLLVSDHDARGRQEWIDAVVLEHLGPFAMSQRLGKPDEPASVTAWNRRSPARCPKCGHATVTVMSQYGQRVWIAACARCEHAVDAETAREAARKWNEAAGPQAVAP